MIATTPTRSLRYDAAEATLVLTTPTGTEAYSVHYLPAPAGARVVRLGKYDLKTKYTVTLFGAGSARCTCPAGHHGKPCKHVDAIRVLAGRGELPAAPAPAPKPVRYNTAESTGF